MQSYRRVGEWMVEHGVLTEEQLNRALKMKSQQDRRFGEVLVLNGFCTEDDVTECLAEQFDLAVVDFSKIHPKASAYNLISGSFALNRLVLPFQLKDGVLDCIVSDPVDIQSTDEVRDRAGVPLRLHLAPTSALRAAIQRTYKLPKMNESTPSGKKLPIDMQTDRSALLRALQDGGQVA